MAHSSPIPAAEQRSRRPLATVALVVGALITVACLSSEWRGVAYWTPVHGDRPHQDFVLFARGELRLGTRSTAGFFTRAIAAPGLRIEPPSRMLLNPADRMWMAWWYERPQTGVFILPVTPIAMAFTGVCFARLAVRKRGPRECGSCGYDLTGAPTERCPECGRFPNPAR